MYNRFARKFVLLFVLSVLFTACIKYEHDNRVIEWAKKTGAYNIQTDVSYLGITSMPDGAVAGIQFMSAPVNDVQIQELSELEPNIYSIGLVNSNITDAGVRSLANIGSLRSIGLDGTKITDDSLDYLASLKQLKRLSLRKTGVTDSGLVKLKSNVQLEALDLGHTKVAGSGLKGYVDNLIELYLNNTMMDDNGVKNLVGFNKLQVLDLSGTKITDSSIPELLKLSALSSLTLYNCNLTIEGKAKLRQGMSKTKILF